MCQLWTEQLGLVRIGKGDKDTRQTKGGGGGCVVLVLVSLFVWREGGGRKRDMRATRVCGLRFLCGKKGEPRLD